MTSPHKKDGLDAVPSTFAREPLSLSTVLTGDVRTLVAQAIDGEERISSPRGSDREVIIPHQGTKGRAIRGEFRDGLLDDPSDYARQAPTIPSGATRSARDMLSRID